MPEFTRRALGVAAASFALVASAAIAQSPPAGPPVRVRATIEKVDGNALMVKLNSGQSATIKMPDNVRVLGIEKTTIGDVKAGNYVGVSSMPQTDGSQKAMHVHIFPEALRGVAEGQSPWDSRPGALMTNAAVETTVTGNDGQTLTLKYKGEEKKIIVPPDAIIVKYVPGDKAELTPGTKIFIAGAQKQPDETLTAANISYGKNGLTPPM
jgi:hypothetical protein